MKKNPNRREAFSIGVASGVLAAPTMNVQDEKTDEDSVTRDQRFVMEAGMTREEAECWKLTAAAAGSFFKLPVLHPTDATEVAHAIHVIQNKLLARPTYRKYLELAKAGVNADPKQQK